MRRAILIILCLLQCRVFSKTIQVNVLTLSTLPLSINAVSQNLGEALHFSVTLSCLDLADKLLTQSNALISRNTAISTGQLQLLIAKRYTTNKHAIASSVEGISLATALGIIRLPAIVFEHHIIVYGTTDVLAAYQAYRAWQQQAGSQ